jgi:formamidopyrimidine-DNA glycosylase
MPELPEVQTIRDELANKILNKKIKEVEVKFPGLLNVPAKVFISTITGTEIISIRRRAKLLIFDLSNQWSLLIHLKLTGQLIVAGQPGPGKPHLIYHFSDGSKLTHYDLRKFGYAKLIKTAETAAYLEKENLGPEPLSKDFTLEKFKQLLQTKPKALIKPLLMDQTFLAGIGNIYSQEACFFAKILPTRKAGTLNNREISLLYQGLREILKQAIKYKGSSVDSYVNTAGEEGKYVPELKVYGRGGKQCLNCGEILKQEKINGRGTTWCQKCQK